MIKKLCLLAVVAIMPMVMNANVKSFVPQPEKVAVQPGTSTFAAGSTVGYTDQATAPAAEFAAKMLSKASGVKFTAVKGKGSVTLKLTKNKKATEGAYKLTVAGNSAVITSANYNGIINGVSTLFQMFDPNSATIENVSISDSPAYQWRGLHLDVSRHFFTVSEVKDFLEVMASYKFNKFHWHLTDDQGWRIEIKRYPLLTEKGAWRTYNNQDLDCMKTARLTDNKDCLLPTDERQHKDGDTNVYGGFYTQEQIKDVVAYAGRLGIDVIPEIDMPGHMLAAVSNYNGVACSDETGWGELFSSPVCPGKDSALEFCKNIYAEIFPLFPYEYVHIGGDEVAKENWKKCPDCQARIREKGLKNEHELQSWFIDQMEQYFNANGKNMIGWDECLEGGLSKTASVSWWRSWSKDAPTIATAQGNKVIVMPNNRFYLDNEEDPTNLASIYGYDPTESAANKALIWGVQGALWAEKIPTTARLYYRAFPRSFAIAEMGWTKVRNDFDGFKQRAVNQMARLNAYGINYRIPNYDNFNVLNAFTGETTINLTCSDKTAVTRYTTDGTIPTANSTLYTGPIPVKETTLFTFRNFHPDGHPGDFYRARYEKQTYGKAIVADGTEKAGLVADWYDYTGPKCSTIETAPYKRSFVIDDVVIPEGATGNIGLVINGYVNIPADDIYTFTLRSDDGSILVIDSKMVVDNDGEHAPFQLSGQIALSKGLHPIQVKYFDHNGGTLSVKVQNSKGETVPAKGLYCH